jgi:hypothetical protein
VLPAGGVWSRSIPPFGARRCARSYTAAARAVVSVDGLGAASEATRYGRRAPALPLAITLAVVSLVMLSLGLATSLVIMSSGQRGVRGGVTRDRQRCRCTRTSRECCRVALRIWGLCFQCPMERWWASCLRYRLQQRAQWRARCTSGVWQRIASGFAVYASVDALSSGVGIWCPRDGVRGVVQGACDIFRGGE